MTLMVHKSTLPTFEFAPNPEFDAEINAIKTRYESIMDGIKNKKISAADVYYSGASITDQTTQTEVGEIVDVKSATKMLMALTEDSKNLKSKLEVFYESTMTEYQDLVNSKANLIYDQCAELLRDIQRQNEATLERTRRAYKQQLADAISSLSSMYTKNMQLKLRTVELRQTDISEKYTAENARLRDRIRQLEDQITLMSREMGEIERAKALEWNEGEEDMVSVAVSPFAQPNIQPGVADPALLVKLQLQDAQITELKAKILDNEVIIKNRDAHIDKLEKELKDLGNDQASAATEVERLILEKARLENELASTVEKFHAQVNENRQLKRLAIINVGDELPENAKSELKEKLASLELDLANSIEAAKVEAREQFKKDFNAAIEQERARYIALAEEKRRVETELARERKAILERSKDDRDVEAMRAAKIRSEAEAERMRREVDRIHRMWEKKFNILQASLHALKDEMFVRRYLEKQAAQLHTSAVAFVFGKHSNQDIPRPPDATVRSKTMTGMGDDMKGYSGPNSSHEARKSIEPGPFEGAGVPFRPPNINKRRTVWDTRPPTQTSTTNHSASGVNQPDSTDQDQTPRQNITNAE